MLNPLSQAIGDMAQALAEVLITANTALEDEGVADWAEGGRLGDALIAIRDAAETAIKTAGTSQAIPANHAPELLEMVEMLADGLAWNLDNTVLLNESDSEALAAARALIAKVRGEVTE